MEKEVLAKDREIKEYLGKIKELEERVFTVEQVLKKDSAPEKRKFKCSECDFETNSSQGLKVDVKRKHTLSGNETYPRKCDLCESIIENNVDMKNHLKTHTYQQISLKCQECEFSSNNRYSMHIHHGKKHSQTLHCGLCDFDSKTLENLDIHLFTCEIFKCMGCQLKEKTLSNIKKHIKECHPKGSEFFNHQKMDRVKINEVNDKTYILREDEEEPHAW